MPQKQKRKNKYQKGERYRSLETLATDITLGQWVYYWDRVIHPAWIAHMPFGTVTKSFDLGLFSKAIKTGDRK